MPDPLESASKGVTKGLLEWTEEKLKELVKRFSNREVAFVEDKPSAEAIKKQDQTSEYKILCNFIPKGYFRILVRSGLALREIENDQDRVNRFRSNVYSKYGASGVRIAELTQMGIVTQLLAHLAKIYQNPPDVQKKLLAFFDQVDQLTIFVKTDDSERVERISGLVRERVDTNPSQMVILFGRAKAVRVLLKILKDIKADPRDYSIEIQQEGYQLTAFIFSPEVKEKLTSRWERLTSV